MSRMAIPDYIKKTTSDIPPGHRFKLYFRAWDNNLTRILKSEKRRSVNYVVNYSSTDEISAIINRKRFFALQFESDIRKYNAVTISSLVTGLGNEHPLENGFSFFDPWGVPYLPGSSVKGVLRLAAETLALFEEDTKGWTLGAVFWLFGFDSQSAYLRAAPRNETKLNKDRRLEWQKRYRKRIKEDHLAEIFIKRYFPVKQKDTRLDTKKLRDIQNDNNALKTIHYAGALQFWDAIFYPQKSNQQWMSVDIMAPHFQNYYQKKEYQRQNIQNRNNLMIQPPSDNKGPNVLYFLVIPPETGIDFFTAFSPVKSFPETLARSWSDLLDSAFDYAAENLGFGAKTTAGYGRLKRINQHS